MAICWVSDLLSGRMGYLYSSLTRTIGSFLLGGAAVVLPFGKLIRPLRRQVALCRLLRSIQRWVCYLWCRTDHGCPDCRPRAGGNGRKRHVPRGHDTAVRQYI